VAAARSQVRSWLGSCPSGGGWATLETHRESI